MRCSRAVFLLGVTALLTSCIVRLGSVTSLTPESAVGTDVRTPLKAFHVDGTITVFASGARVTDEWVMGAGTRYSLDLSSSSVVQRVPLDSLVGIEAFRGGTNPIASVLLSSLAVFAAVGGFKTHRDDPTLLVRVSAAPRRLADSQELEVVDVVRLERLVAHLEPHLGALVGVRGQAVDITGFQQGRDAVREGLRMEHLLAVLVG